MVIELERNGEMWNWRLVATTYGESLCCRTTLCPVRPTYDRIKLFYEDARSDDSRNGQPFVDWSGNSAKSVPRCAGLGGQRLAKRPPKAVPRRTKRPGIRCVRRSATN